MNWYRLTKDAQSKQKNLPLPAAEGMPSFDDMGTGAAMIHHRMSPEVAQQQSSYYDGKQEWLGEGSYGAALTAGPGQAVKFTTDEDEALSANHVAQLQAQGIAQWAASIYRVEQLPQEEELALFAIVMEKLGPLSEMEQKIIKLLVSRRTAPPHQLIDTLLDTIDEYKLTREFRYIGVSVTEAKRIAKKYGQMLIAMRKDGASVDDAHWGNIGVKPDGSYAMFDMGMLYYLD